MYIIYPFRMRASLVDCQCNNKAKPSDHGIVFANNNRALTDACAPRDPFDNAAIDM